MLLKADPRLEDNVDDDKADPWCAYNLRRYLSCSLFNRPGVAGAVL